MSVNCLATEKGPAEIVLHSTIDPASRSKPAFFPHAVHQGNFPCSTCHHLQGENGKMIVYSEGMEISKCESCHNTSSSLPAKLNTFKEAAHERCKGCHLQRTNEGLKAGPTKCNGCHRKDLK